MRSELSVVTRKWTVHVFAVSPYGGQPDTRSHLESPECFQSYKQLLMMN